MRTIEDTTNPLGELVSAQRIIAVGLEHFSLAVYPLGFSHGLCLGNKQLTILTPSPLSLTWRLCLPSQRLTSLEMCQEALSQMRTITFFPAAWSFCRLHERNCVVMELMGLPSTNLIHVWSSWGT
jgi:hypothetical protein